MINGPNFRDVCGTDEVGIYMENIRELTKGLRKGIMEAKDYVGKPDLAVT